MYRLYVPWTSLTVFHAGNGQPSEAHIDLIEVISARKAKSRAQLSPMRITVANGGTKHCFLLDSWYAPNSLFGWYTPTSEDTTSEAYIK